MPAASGPDLSVVVLSWNTKELLRSCLASLRADSAGELRREIIVVDNASADGSAGMVAAEFPECVLVRNEQNLGYAEGNNTGARAATGEFVCLLNSDTEVRAGALDQVVRFLREHPEYGAASPKLVNPDGTVQRACMRFPGICVGVVFDNWLARFPPGKWIDDWYYMRDFDHQAARDVDQPPGACFLMRRDEYLREGGLDLALFLYFNDVDLCRRLARRGRKIRYLAGAEVVHHGGASTRKFDRMIVVWHKNRLAYYRKHYGRAAVILLKAVVCMRAFEEWLGARKRQRDRAGVRAERAHIRQMLKEILTGTVSGPNS